MGLPNNLVFVRHGESEINTERHRAKHDKNNITNPAIYERLDWQQRLSPRGIEQARMAGRWILKEMSGGIQDFDSRLVSPYLRARETALYLGNPELDMGNLITVAEVNDCWEVDDRLAERGWGVHAVLTYDQQRISYPNTQALNEIDPWHTALEGGESLASGVSLRVRNLLDTIMQQPDGQSIIYVAHGEIMWAVRQVMERLLPEEWLALYRDRSQMINNCSVLQYSRVNPFDPADVRPRMGWTRLVYTDESSASVDGGAWRELPEQRRFGAADFIQQLKAVEPLINKVDK